MRVFREVVPQEKKESRPAVRYQEARIEKKMDVPQVLQPRYTKEEYRSLYRKQSGNWRTYYVFAALV